MLTRGQLGRGGRGQRDAVQRQQEISPELALAECLRTEQRERRRWQERALALQAQLQEGQRASSTHVEAAQAVVHMHESNATANHERAEALSRKLLNAEAAIEAAEQGRESFFRGYAHASCHCSHITGRAGHSDRDR